MYRILMKLRKIKEFKEGKKDNFKINIKRNVKFATISNTKDYFARTVKIAYNFNANNLRYLKNESTKPETQDSNEYADNK